jgi:hypothetical protein
MTEVLAPAVYEAWKLFSSSKSVREIAKRFPELDIFPSSCIHDMYVIDRDVIFVQILSKDGMSYKEYAYVIPMNCSRTHGVLFDLRKAMFETCSLGKALQILKANFEYELIGEFTLGAQV